jgi:hypothetical protein
MTWGHHPEGIKTMSQSKKRNRAERDGWSDGFAGADDMTCCQYKATETREAYEKGRAAGYAARRKAEERTSEQSE